MTDEILTLDEVCSFLRVSRPTAYRYVRSGGLPAFKMGKAWKFNRTALVHWVNTRTQQDTEARSRGQIVANKPATKAKK